MRVARVVAISLASVLGVLTIRPQAFAWQVRVGRANEITDVTVDGAGDVFATASIKGEIRPPSAFIVLKLRASDGGLVWKFDQTQEEGGASNVAVDGAGDVMAAGSGVDGALVVTKLAGATGDQLWSFADTAAWAPPQAAALAVDAAGDVFVLGGNFTVLKLRGGDGTELWRRSVAGTAPLGSGIAVDGSGDVVAVGSVVNATRDFVVVKLSGADGTDRWSPVIIDGTAASLDLGNAVAVDGNGDIVGAGEIRDTPSNGRFTVVKLSGVTGLELWRHKLEGSDAGCPDGFASSVAVDAWGDVAAVGTTCNLGASLDLSVVKLSGATGAREWQQTFNGTNDRPDIGVAVAFDPGGNVVVGGDVDNIAASCTPPTICGNFDLTVLKLARATGDELWRRVINGKQDTDDRLSALVLDPAGNVVAGGSFRNVLRDGLVVKHSENVAGRRLLVVDEDGNPAARRLVLRAKDRGLSPPDPGSSGDPTVGGATVVLLNPTSGERDTIALPAGNWKGLGKPPGSRGYRYRANGATDGPCVAARLRRNALSLKCRGSAMEFSLDESSQGSLVVTLTTGVGADRHCSLFGGMVVADNGTVTGGTGRFDARQAPPAVGGCQIP